MVYEFLKVRHVLIFFSLVSAPPVVFDYPLHVIGDQSLNVTYKANLLGVDNWLKFGQILIYLHNNGKLGRILAFIRYSFHLWPVFLLECLNMYQNAFRH